MMKLGNRRIVLALLILFSFSVQQASAENLLDRAFADACKHDFVDHFQFKEKETIVSKETGVTEHLFASPVCGGFLGLGVTDEGRIVHMRLGLPRDLLDDPARTVFGRDVIKSFVESCATTEGDWKILKVMSDEIYVRGLDLHSVPLKTTKFADTGKPVPEPVGYKVGTGPVKKGDQLILIDKLPDLSGKPSDIFLTVTGKLERANKILGNCRVGFVSQKGGGQKPAVLICDVWDEPYWQSHLEPPPKAQDAPGAGEPKNAPPEGKQSTAGH